MAPSGKIVLAAAARGYIWKHVVQYQHTYSPYTRALILGMNNQAGNFKSKHIWWSKTIRKYSHNTRTNKYKHASASSAISWLYLLVLVLNRLYGLDQSVQ